MTRFSILLSHTPEIYQQAAHAGFDVLLAGHTHGGQICLPGSIAITLQAPLPRAFGAGAWRYGRMAGYTSVVCTIGVVAVRFNCLPEITLHRLERPRQLAGREFADPEEVTPATSTSCRCPASPPAARSPARGRGSGPGAHRRESSQSGRPRSKRGPERWAGLLKSSQKALRRRTVPSTNRSGTARGLACTKGSSSLTWTPPANSRHLALGPTRWSRMVIPTSLKRIG